MLVADPTVTRMPEAAALQVSSGWTATHVAAAPEVVLAVAAGNLSAAARLPLEFEISTALPSVHVVVGLAPQERYEVRTGSTTRTLRAGAEGILACVDSEVGQHLVRVSHAVP
jgi:hypothetical protein